MGVENEIKKGRLQKLAKIRKMNINPYPGEIKRTHTNKECSDNFSEIFHSQEEVILVGRIMAIRIHGKITFINIKDGTATFQIFLQKDGLGENFYNFCLENLDIGDFIEIKGVLFKTKKDEKTLKTNDLKFLSKGLLPLPEKWQGLKNIEDRYRKRYLDLIFNDQVRAKFEIRAKVITEIRSFLDKEGFLEVETPVLQPIYGGAGAKPFKTHLNALNMDMYLRIAPELYLKRLLIGGLEKVYELGKNFRNEGIDRSHNPDFTFVEFYWAYVDYKDLMNFTEKLLSAIVKKVYGTFKILYEGKEIDFGASCPRLDFSELIREHAGVDIDKSDTKTLMLFCKKNGIKTEKNSTKIEIVDEIFKKFCRSKIWKPSFVVHHPLGFQPLAKTLDQNPKKLANFQLIIAGWEMANAFSELNDSQEQRLRFREEEAFYEKGMKEAQRLDEDYLEAMEYGMPPAAGFGLGVDRLVALLTDSHTLREVILFPTMKNKR